MQNLDVAKKYANDVISGCIPACQYIKQSAQIFLDTLKDPRYYYDPTEVDALVEFISNFEFTETDTKINMYLEPWQLFLVVQLYGIYVKATGKRKHRSLYLELPRKNSKSTLICILGFWHFLTDKDSVVTLSANSFRQAKNVDFKKMLQYTKQIDPKGKHIKQHYDQLIFKENGNEIILFASDSGTVDGYNINFALVDEYHESVDSKMVDVLRSGMVNRKQPILAIVTTAGFNTNSACYIHRQNCIDILAGVKDDPAQLSMIYTVDKEDLQDYNKMFESEIIIKKANPNYLVSIDKDGLQAEINKAINSDQDRVSVLTKHFNVWLQNNTTEQWIPEDIINQSMKNIKLTDAQFLGLTVFCGVDLGSVSDLTSVTYLAQLDDKFYFFNGLYICEESLNTSINRDLFKEAAVSGLINITNGNVTDFDYILQDMLKVHQHNEIQEVAYDKFNATQWAISATESGLFLKPFSQVAGNLNKPLKEFERLIKSGKIVIQKNFLVKWCMMNVVVKTNSMGNISIDRNSRTKKIDAVASMINSLGCYLNNPVSNFNIW